jgi:hypothetical protein
MEMKTVMPSQYFSGNKLTATEMRGGRIKIAASADKGCLFPCMFVFCLLAQKLLLVMDGKTTYKRAVKLLEPAEIAQAMSWTCSCQAPCALKWTREGLRNAGHHYLKRTLEEQMVFVYNILLVAYNCDLRLLRLTITGKLSKLSN